MPDIQDESPTMGITEDDLRRIRAFLKKPRYRRDQNDLRPDE